LGAYLYSLSRVWVDYDEKRRQFTPQALTYGDGSRTNGNAAELQTFRAYVKEHGEPPTSRQSLREWYKATA